MSGEADYTQRVRVMQHIAPDARILITGQQASTTLTDEGTESSAASYTAWQGATVADDTGTKDTGANSLKYTCDSAGKHSAAYRALSSNFVWGNLVQVVIKTYRPSGEFDATGDVIRLIFLKSNSITADGMVYEIPISADAADTWITHTIAKGDFLAHYGGLSDGDTVTTMAFHNINTKSDAGDYVFLDAHDVYAELGDTVAILVDSAGHPQVDIVSQAALPAGTNNIGDVDIATICSLVAGTANIGKVDIADILKTATWYIAKVTASGTTDLITPTAGKKIQVKFREVVSATDDVEVKIWEEDNNTNMVYYSNLLDGSAVSGNLIGCNYITSTVSKKLQANLSKAANVYIAIAYVEV